MMSLMAHQLLVSFFKDGPSLAAVMVEGLGVWLPPHTEARLAAAEAQPDDDRADAVVVLLDGDTPIRAIVIEVQLEIDPQRRLRWPAYVTAARAIHGCPAELLVVAPAPHVTGWCGEPIETGVPGFVLRPRVLAVPVIKEAWAAARWPDLGVLSALVYGESELGATIAAAVLPAIREFDDHRALMYFDLVYSALNETAREQ